MISLFSKSNQTPSILRGYSSVKTNFSSEYPTASSLIYERKATRKHYKRVKDSSNQELPNFKTNCQTALLTDPHEALAARIQLIRQAKHSIDYSTFTFAPDDTGYAILEELRQAVKRGVIVRLLVDSIGSIIGAAQFHNEFKALEKTKGIVIDDELQITSFASVVINNPLLNMHQRTKKWAKKITNIFYELDLPVPYTNLGHRMHDKMIIADGKFEGSLIIGGRNSSNAYFSAKIYEDIEILSQFPPSDNNDLSLGDIATQHFEKLFLRLGNSKLSKTAFFKITPKQYYKQLKKMRKSHKNIEKIIEPFKFPLDVHHSTATFLDEFANVGGKDRLSPTSIVNNFTKSCQNAKHVIEIVSPYFTLTRDEIDFYLDWLAKDKNRKLRIVSNSLLSTDENFLGICLFDNTVGHAFKNTTEDIKKRIELYSYGRLDSNELDGDKIYGKLHAKFALIDHETAFVMSSNLNPRSRYYDSEIGIKIENSASVQEIRKNFDKIITDSHLWKSEEWKAIRHHPKLFEKRISLASVGCLYHFVKHCI